ncbi:MAG: hypothetical protein H6620_10595 [Halobacteriovoraceae bacterium]|nr:hypothetical protein [Halobacteriovoraceae bacterium]
MGSVPFKYFLSKSPLKERQLPEKKKASYSYGQQKTPLKHAIFPFIPLGLHFIDDIVLTLEGDDPWAMIEVSKAMTPEGKIVWFVLDSYLDGKQVVGLPKHGLEEAKAYATHFPSAVYEAELEVIEKDYPHYREFEVSYKRLGTEYIHFICRASKELKPALFKNGHTMNHSDQLANIVLHIDHLSALKNVSFFTPKKRMKKILGFPVQVMMGQTACGFAAGEWEQVNEGLQRAQQNIEVEEGLEYSILKTLPEFKISFSKNSTFFEIEKAQLIDPSKNYQVGQFEFFPALPDLRFEFADTQGEYVIGASSQRALAKGIYRVTQNSQGFKIYLQGVWPSWTSNRPMEIIGQYTDKGVRLISSRIFN